jgi:hypothetical protein
MKAYVRVTDLSTGRTEKVACFSNTDTIVKQINRRVIKRAASMYENAVRMGIKGARYAFYVQYSWRLEVGRNMNPVPVIA